MNLKSNKNVTKQSFCLHFYTSTNDDEQIKNLIDVAIEEYDKRWKNRQYPSITVGSLCSWVGQEALKIYIDRQKQVTDRVDKYADLEVEEEFEL